MNAISDPVAAYAAQLDLMAVSTNVVRLGSMRLERDTLRLCGSVAYVKLGLQQFIVLERLSRRVGVIVEDTRMLDALYPDGDEPETAQEVLRNRVRDLRHSLMMLGDTVRVERVKEMGYRLVVKGAR
jgi:DNA-binding response OmpR family regulator